MRGRSRERCCSLSEMVGMMRDDGGASESRRICCAAWAYPGPLKSDNAYERRDSSVYVSY